MQNAIFLTFDPEVSRAAHTLSLDGRHLPRSTLTRVVSIVNNPVQFASWPFVNVKVQDRVDGFEIVFRIIRGTLAKVDGVPLVVFVNWHAIFQPENFAQWRAFDLE